VPNGGTKRKQMRTNVRPPQPTASAWRVLRSRESIFSRLRGKRPSCRSQLRRARFIVAARRYARAHNRLECVRTNGSYIGYRDGRWVYQQFLWIANLLNLMSFIESFIEGHHLIATLFDNYIGEYSEIYVNISLY